MTVTNVFTDRKSIDWTSQELKVDEIPNKKFTYGSIEIFEDGIGRKIGIPVIAVKGNEEGPVLGVTAAIHGNELNGIPVIFKLLQNINLEQFYGTLIAVPIINIPGYLSYQRTFEDGVDLNRIMPGKIDGPPSSVYAFNIFERIASKFDIHIDLHTASFGRINSHYVRADLSIPDVFELVKLQHSQIVVHTRGPKGSFRNASVSSNHPAITIELGNPQIFQHKFIGHAVQSIKNVMSYMHMINDPILEPETKPYLCNKSYWVRCLDGGVLEIFPELTQLIHKNEKIAKLMDIYGRDTVNYVAPDDGIVIGKNNNPVASTGDRIIHLGILGSPKGLKNVEENFVVS